MKFIKVLNTKCVTDVLQRPLIIFFCNQGKSMCCLESSFVGVLVDSKLTVSQPCTLMEKWSIVSWAAGGGALPAGRWLRLCAQQHWWGWLWRTVCAVVSNVLVESQLPLKFLCTGNFYRNTVVTQKSFLHLVDTLHQSQGWISFYLETNFYVNTHVLKAVICTLPAENK